MVTDAKPVADLRREAHNLYSVWHDGESNPHCMICILADRAEAAEKAAFGEHTLAQEWQGRAEAAEQHVKILREARDEALARIANEIAARQRAQEHGIGDRARIEELEREAGRLRGAMYDALSTPHTHTDVCRVIKAALETK